MLQFNGNWRFESPGAIPAGVMREFSDLIGKITTQGDVQVVYERFKSYFASAAGSISSWSSSASWAQTDLDAHMQEAAVNAPLFIEAFYDACESLRKNGTAVPNVRLMNRILVKHNAGYEIRPPDLVSTDEELKAIEVPDEAPSFDHQAREIIGASLQQSEQLLSEGRDRQAVQELLWLLKTVSAAFHGLDMRTGTVQGKYFNKIV